jgi:ABC-type uncharacterized transport system ATPase subunit
MTAVPLLEARGLTMRFGGVTAVNNVNFVLNELELRCLIGPNGAGKSTFFKTLTGQLKPSDGKVLFRGEDITGAYPHQVARRGVGIKTQVPNVFDGLTVRENVFVAAARLHPARAARRIADETLERVGLTRIIERQVAVLAQDPELILLDEPAAGMNKEEVARTSELIREINTTHALIVVEHDMQFIRMIAKKVTVFNQGSILIEDGVGTVLADRAVRDVYLGKQAA